MRYIQMKSLSRFRKVNRAFPKTEEILSFKSRSKKASTRLCSRVPEEIIHYVAAKNQF